MKCSGCHREASLVGPIKLYASLLYLCPSCLDIDEAMRVAEEERKFRAIKRRKEE